MAFAICSDIMITAILIIQRIIKIIIAKAQAAPATATWGSTEGYIVLPWACLCHLAVFAPINARRMPAITTSMSYSYSSSGSDPGAQGP